MAVEILNAISLIYKFLFLLSAGKDYLPLQRMKYLAFIFSIYFVLLALLPCQDRNEIATQVKTLASVQKSHPGNDQCGQESCPPFCSCTCCSTARKLTANSVFAIFTQTIARSYAEHAVAAICEQSVAIWQPPQII